MLILYFILKNIQDILGVTSLCKKILHSHLRKRAIKLWYFWRTQEVYCHDKKSGQLITIPDVIFTFILKKIEDILGVKSLCKELSHIHLWIIITSLPLLRLNNWNYIITGVAQPPLANYALFLLRYICLHRKRTIECAFSVTLVTWLCGIGQLLSEKWWF